MIFSYSLGTSIRSENLINSKEDYLNKNKTIEFGTKTRDNVETQLKKYNDNPSEDQIKTLTALVEQYNLNTNMLIAANRWFVLNDAPEKYTYDLFSDKNFGIRQILNLSFENKKEITFDKKVSLLTYSNIIKNKLYKLGSEENFASSESSDSNFYESYDDY